VRFVVKLGGAALEDKKILHACGKAIADLVADGNQVAVVHGGGVQLTRTLAAMGKKSEFISGLRITDAETRDAALMVLAGRVNKSLVAAIGSHGQSAVGLSGGDGHVFRARKKKTNPDLGFVGEIAAMDPKWLEAIWTMGAVPVISSIALGFDGEYYNINADEMAAACAIGTKADALVFLTDVPGVKGPWKKRRSSPAVCSPNSTPVAKPSLTASNVYAFFLQKQHLYYLTSSPRGSTTERRSWSHERSTEIEIDPGSREEAAP